MLLNKKSIEKNINRIFIVSMIAIVAIFLSRIKYGMADVDETFYLSIPYRILQGDCYFIDEWNLAQMYSFMMLPIMKAYLAVFGTTEGIVIAFRVIYIIVQMTVTIIGYILLKKEDKIMALVSSWIFCLFAPYNIIALSYNTISLMAMYIFFILSMYKTEHNVIRSLALGIVLAVAVLANPFLIIFWLVYMAVSIFFKIKKHYNPVFNLKSFMYITIGAGIIAIIFFLFILTRVSFTHFISKLYESMPYMKPDAGHSPVKMFNIVSIIITFLKRFRLYVIPLLSVLVLSLIGIWAKKKRFIIFSVIAFITGASTLYSAINHVHNVIMIPLTILGLVAFIYCKNRNYRIFKYLYLLPAVHIIILSASSNNGVMAMAMGYIMPSCASLFFIRDFLNEYGMKKIDMRKALFGLIIIVQIVSQVYAGTQLFFWENDKATLTTCIEQGPLKGIHTTSEKAEVYNADSRNIKKMKNYKGKNVLFFKKFISGYLMLKDTRVGGFSTWIYDQVWSLYDTKLLGYYEVNPDKVPQIIYVDVETAETYQEISFAVWCEKNNYKHKTLKNGGMILRRKGQ